MSHSFFADIPRLRYLARFGALGHKPAWDREATGVAPMSVFESFAGCMAPYLASVDLPLETVVTSEFADLQSHFIQAKTGIPNVGSITQPDVPQRVLAVTNGKGIDGIIGGSPCQPFSCAGRMEGLDDERGGNVLEPWLKHIHALRPKWWLWENVGSVRSDHTNGMGHLFGKGVGYVRPRVPMNRLLADPAVNAVADAVGDAFATWADGSRAAAEALLDREAFREQATENGKFAETRRGQLAKDRGVHPEAKAAVMQGDSDAFLSAVAGLAPEAALACLDAWASFTPANHELTLPRDLWSWSKGRVSRRWPPHGLVLGPAYRLAWRQYDSQFWGVPQHRERIYLVAIRSDMPPELDPSNIMFEF